MNTNEAKPDSNNGKSADTPNDDNLTSEPPPTDKKEVDQKQPPDDSKQMSESAEENASVTKPSNEPVSILQLRVTLRYINPPIWRCLQVSNEDTFYDLHWYLRAVMGWSSDHPHHFVVYDAQDNIIFIDNGSIEEITGEASGSLKEQTTNLSEFFSTKGDFLIYEHLSGDSWIHDIVLEKVLPPPGPEEQLPKCIGGERGCPPEDCGGVDGYKHLIEVYNDPNHEEYEELIVEWLGNSEPEWEPERFDKEQVFKKI